MIKTSNLITLHLQDGNEVFILNKYQIVMFYNSSPNWFNCGHTTIKYIKNNIINTISVKETICEVEKLLQPNSVYLQLTTVKSQHCFINQYYINSIAAETIRKDSVDIFDTPDDEYIKCSTIYFNLDIEPIHVTTSTDDISKAFSN
jgi:hypothetical protein